MQHKFEANKPSLYRTITNLLHTILQVTGRKFGKTNPGQSWKSICQASEATVQYKTITVVKWIKVNLPPLLLAG